MYKIRKFVRRNRVKVIAAATVAGVLVVGLIISMTMYLQKKHAIEALAKLETQVEADRSLSTVQKLYAEGRYQAALAEIETNLQRGDGGPKARLLHAHLLFELDRFSDAAIELEKLLTEQPEIAGTAHYLLARILVGSDPNKSEKHRQLAELLLPQTAEAYSLRGMTADTPEKTIEWLSKALELDPGHYPSRKARTLAYYAMKDYKNVEKDAEALIVMRPKDSLVYSLRAIARREMGRFDDAINDNNRAIQICDVKSELAELYNQRRETYERMGDHKAALQDAQRCVELDPNEPLYRLNVFAGLVLLGQYEPARQEYKKSIILLAPPEWQPYILMLANSVAMRYVFELLGSGRPFELPADFALSPPFSAMQEATDSYRRLQKKAVRLVPSVFGQTSWSPDGKQLAYGRTDRYAWQPEISSRTGAPAIYGSSGIEILDLESGTTRLLVSSGKDPAWSPDGKYIVFIREPYQEELWIMLASGGEPRRLTVGHWPKWASDSKRIFFHSYADMALYSISVDDPDAKPERIIDCPGAHPAVSPDEKYVAYAVGSELRIVEISSGQVVTKWVAPGPERGLLVNWSLDGKEIFLGGFHDSDLGLWCFDVGHKDAWQIFDSPAISCSLSPDRSRMAFELRMPFGEIWLAKLDPNIPTYQALAPVLTRDEFLTHRYEQYLRAAKTGALEGISQIYMGRFIQMLVTLGTNQYRQANYKDAVVSLTRADQLRLALNNKPDPGDMAHIAISLHQLGRKQEALAALNQLRLLFEDDEYADRISLLREAEQSFVGKDSKVYLVWECIKNEKLQEASQIIDELRSQPSQDAQIAASLKSAAKVLSRAYCNRAGGGYVETFANYQAATSIDPCNARALDSFAWLLATCPDANFRDGAKAIGNSTKACKLTNWKNHKYLSTLAAAYAEAGDFDAATKWQKEAIDLLPEDKRTTLQHSYQWRLKLYQSRMPYHQSIIGWWKFDGDAKDSSGSELHGKIVGHAKIVSDPVRGKVLSLDGSGDYVDCGNNPVFDITGAITLSCWIKVTKFDKSWQAIVTKGDGAWRLQRDRENDCLEFACTGLTAAGPGYGNLIGKKKVADGQWHYVCGTYDGENIRLYIDGVQDLASPAMFSDNIGTNSESVYIGENSEQRGREWNGLIDDVRIYSYALDETQVEALFFETGGVRVTKPCPTNGASIEVTPAVKLSWNPSKNASGYHIFFGTDPNRMALLGKVKDVNSIQSPKIEKLKRYYWRVDAVKLNGSMVEGEVWSFWTANMLGWWKFDEAGGQIATDSSGLNNVGKLVGEPQWVLGRMGGAIELDGIKDHIEVQGLDLTTDSVTFVAWINGWKADHWAGIVFYRVGTRPGQPACGMHFGDNNTLHYTWNNNEEATWSWTGGPVLPQNKWAMVAVVIEPSQATAYVYTEEDGLQKGVNNIPHIPQRIGSLMIGWDNHTGFPRRRFRGKIDDVRIYSYALSEANIKALFAGKGAAKPLAK